MFNENFVNKWQKNAFAYFHNHEATLVQSGDLEILTWKDRRGSPMYSVRFVFDPKVNRMYVSGDLGAAVFHFTEPATFRNISGYSSLPYFFEKIETATNTIEYVSDRTEFEEDLGYFANFVVPDNCEYYESDFAEMVDRLWECYGDNGIELDPELYEIVNAWTFYRNDVYEWIGDVGKRIHPRIILWFEALHLARQQTYNEEV